MLVSHRKSSVSSFKRLANEALDTRRMLRLHTFLLACAVPAVLGAQTNAERSAAPSRRGRSVLGDTVGAPFGCSARDALRVIDAWFLAYNSADSAVLDRATAPSFVFTTGKHWIPGDQHRRIDDTVAVLVKYVRERHEQHETLNLDSVRFHGWRGARLGFMPYYTRSANDLGGRPIPGLGKAEVWCHLGIRVLNLAPVRQQLR